MGTLFDIELPNKQNAPLEDVEITTLILYLSKKERKEFGKLAKEGIKQMFGQDFQAKGNLTDFLLNLMREKYGSTEANT